MRVGYGGWYEFPCGHPLDFVPLQGEEVELPANLRGWIGWDGWDNITKVIVRDVPYFPRGTAKAWEYVKARPELAALLGNSQDAQVVVARQLGFRF